MNPKLLICNLLWYSSRVCIQNKKLEFHSLGSLVITQLNTTVVVFNFLDPLSKSLCKICNRNFTSKCMLFNDNKVKMEIPGKYPAGKYPAGNTPRLHEVSKPDAIISKESTLLVHCSAAAALFTNCSCMIYIHVCKFLWWMYIFHKKKW